MAKQEDCLFLLAHGMIVGGGLIGWDSVVQEHERLETRLRLVKQETELKKVLPLLSELCINQVPLHRLHTNVRVSSCTDTDYAGLFHCENGKPTRIFAFGKGQTFTLADLNPYLDIHFPNMSRIFVGCLAPVTKGCVKYIYDGEIAMIQKEYDLKIKTGYNDYVNAFLARFPEMDLT